MAKIYPVIVASILFGILPLSALAATFSFSPQSGSYGVGENFTVSILADSDQPINAVGGAIGFDTEYLEAVSISKSNSIVNLWIQEPSFSNATTAGNLRFEGVVLNPGFTGFGGKVLSAVFRVKKIGSASLNFTESSMLANDGLGTSVAVFPSPASYVLTEAKAALAQTQDSDLHKRIDAVEKKLKEDGTTQNPTAIFQNLEFSNELVGFWDMLPPWVKMSALVLMAVASIFFALIMAILAAVILVWLWNHVIRRRLIHFFGKLSREMRGDIKYSAHIVEKEFQYAQKSRSLSSVISRYWVGLYQVARRFFTINSK